LASIQENKCLEEERQEERNSLVCLEMFTLNILRKYESDCHWNCWGYRHMESFNPL